MQRNRPTLSRRPQTLRLLGGSCLLLLYLVTATPLAPSLVALLAACDRSHHVIIHQGACGLQVVLRHDCVNSPAHRHGMVARVLTVFAQRTTAPQSDHVIQFNTTDTTPQTPTLAVEPSAETPAPDAFTPCDVWLPAPRLTAFLVALSRPPPAASGLLLTVRSTVFVI